MTVSADLSVCCHHVTGRSQTTGKQCSTSAESVITLTTIVVLQANRYDILACIKKKGTFDPKVGWDILRLIMKYLAKVLLFPVVRPFVLLFFGLTATASLAMVFRIDIGLDQNLALPKVRREGGVNNQAF